MKIRMLGTTVLVCSFLGLASGQQPNGINPAAGIDRAPDGIHAARGGIVYHGGPILGTNASNPVHIYLIFYGNWAALDPGGPGIMTDFINNLGGSGWWNILTSYVTAAGVSIKNGVVLDGTVNDNYSQGKNLNDASLKLVVQKWISNGTFTAKTNAVYHVLSSSDVNETSGFCSAYCGFHTHMTFNGVDIKYAFIGNPVHCVNQGGVADCQGESSNITASPNNDPGVDAMISVLAHESAEATSDPDLNAWYFPNGEENADKCAYTYGTVFSEPNGSKANVTLGNRDYLIQQNWIAAGTQRCALTYP